MARFTSDSPRSPGRSSSSTSAPCPGLRSVIKRAGLTITAAAKLCSWKRTRIATWISQGHAPRVDLEQLCRAIDEHAQQPPGTALARAGEAPVLDPLGEAERRIAAAEAEIAAARAALAKARKL